MKKKIVIFCSICMIFMFIIIFLISKNLKKDNALNTSSMKTKILSVENFENTIMELKPQNQINNENEEISLDNLEENEELPIVVEENVENNYDKINEEETISFSESSYLEQKKDNSDEIVNTQVEEQQEDKIEQIEQIQYDEPVIIEPEPTQPEESTQQEEVKVVEQPKYCIEGGNIHLEGDGENEHRIL